MVKVRPENDLVEMDAPWMGELLRSASGLKEPKQRLLKVLADLKPRSPEEIASFLHWLSNSEESSLARFADLRRAMVTYQDELETLGYDLITEVYEHALDQGWIEVMFLLRSERTASGESEKLPEGFSRKISSFTLGERKQMGRGRKRNVIEMLLFDSDPTVIREVLFNPRVTEKDVIRLAARHHAPSPVLTEICRCEKWISHYRVRKALVFNPRTPLSYALGFLRDLRGEDLRLFLQGGSYAPELTQAARARFLEQRENKKG